MLLTRGEYSKKEGNMKNKDVSYYLEIIYLYKGTYDIVSRVWMVRNLYQGKRMVDLVQI